MGAKNGPRMDPIWAHDGPIMGPKWAHDGPNIDPNWDKMGPRWARYEPTLGPLLAQTYCLEHIYGLQWCATKLISSFNQMISVRDVRETVHANDNFQGMRNARHRTTAYTNAGMQRLLTLVAAANRIQ